MILFVHLKNFLVFGGEATLSLEAEGSIKKFYSNVASSGGRSVLKSCCVYGGNNVGKTCILRAIAALKAVLSDVDCDMPVNIFSGDTKCTLGAAFTLVDEAYYYEFTYDAALSSGRERGFVAERLCRCGKESGESKEIFVRDVDEGRYFFEGDDELGNLLSLVSCSNIAVYTINCQKYPALAKCKDILTSFASSIEVVDMNNIPIDKTISVLKNDSALRERTVELIKLADLDIDDYVYSPETLPSPVSAQERVLTLGSGAEELGRLTSVHRGRAVRSLTFDSTGTKKMVAIASYIIEALSLGKILVVDEMDSSLHFKLTRAIVSLFNNELNLSAQLIFTVHDVTLLDCRRLFRRDQIWFAEKDNGSVTLQRLSDIAANGGDNDIMDRYRSGELGALPEPDLVAVLLGREDDDGGEE